MFEDNLYLSSKEFDGDDEGGSGSGKCDSPLASSTPAAAAVDGYHGLYGSSSLSLSSCDGAEGGYGNRSSRSGRRRRRALGDEIDYLPDMNEAERETCDQVSDHYDNGRYDRCLELLNKLLEIKPNDYRIKNNLNVVNFAISGCTDTEIFYTELKKILLVANINLKKLDQDDIRHPVILFNLSVLYYHHKHFQEALLIVSRISNCLSNIINKFTKRVKLLHVDLLLKIQQFDKAMIEIEQFESHIYSSQSQSQNQSQHHLCSSLSELNSQFHSASPSPTHNYNQSSNLSSASSSYHESHMFEDKEIDKTFEVTVKRKLQQYKTLCCLCLRSLKSAKREYKQLFTLDPSKGNISNKQSNFVEIYIKSYYEYLRGNFKKAVKIILSNSLPKEENWRFFIENGDFLDMINQNNIGCCHFNMGRPTVAAVFFQKATIEAENEAVKDRRKLPMYAKGFERKYELIYNFGISLLHAKHYEEAFQALTTTLKVYKSNPQLYLRLAECCIQIHKDLAEISGDFSIYETLQLKLIEKLKVKNLVESESVSAAVVESRNDDVSSPTRLRQSSNASPILSPTLEYASQCIDKALKLVESTESVESDGCLYIEPSNPITNYQEICHLQSSILCTGAYIELCLSNYTKAKRYIEDLFALGKCNIPGLYVYLGEMYLAEIHLEESDTKKALDTLSQIQNIDLGTHNSLLSSTSEAEIKEDICEIPFVGGLTEKCPRDELTARVVVLYNRAYILAKNGEIQKSADLIQELTKIAEDGQTLVPNDFMDLYAFIDYTLEHKGSVEVEGELDSPRQSSNNHNNNHSSGTRASPFNL